MLVEPNMPVTFYFEFVEGSSITHRREDQRVQSGRLYRRPVDCTDNRNRRRQDCGQAARMRAPVFEDVAVRDRCIVVRDGSQVDDVGEHKQCCDVLEICQKHGEVLVFDERTETE